MDRNLPPKILEGEQSGSSFQNNIKNQAREFQGTLNADLNSLDRGLKIMLLGLEDELKRKNVPAMELDEIMDEMLSKYIVLKESLYKRITADYYKTRRSIVLDTREAKRKIRGQSRDIDRLLNEDTRFEDDERFAGVRIFNKRYVREFTREKLKNFYDKNTDERELKNLGRIALDLNGLKTINDFAGHEKGDEYLKRVILALNDEKIAATAKTRGMTITLSSEGGDEFGFLVEKTTGALLPPNEKTGEGGDLEFLEEIIDGVIKKIDISDLIDFDSDEVREKLLKNGFREKDIPKDFSFEPSIASGHTTLFRAYKTSLNRDKEDREKGHDEIDRGLKHWFGLSEGEMEEHKRETKLDLKQSSNPAENFKYLLMQRNAEAIELAIENKELRLEIKNLTGGREQHERESHENIKVIVIETLRSDSELTREDREKLADIIIKNCK